MRLDIGRTLSLVIALGYTVLAVIYAGPSGLKWSAGLLLPLVLIWFPEELGSVTGYFTSGYVNTQTPAIIVSILGWFSLVGLPILAWLVR